MPERRRRRLRNEDFSDRELLYLIDDAADEDGLTLADEVANLLDFREDERRAVASRMAWMGRYGFLDRVDPREVGRDGPPLWAITEEGRALMGGRVSSAVQRVLDQADPGTELLLMRSIAERGYVRGSEATAHALRRQWMYHQAKRGRF